MISLNQHRDSGSALSLTQRKNEASEAGAVPASAPPAVAPNSDQPGTILSIQFLRFIAALSVVAFHAHSALVGQLVGHKEDRIDHAFTVGSSGVHIFFVISGFVMVYTTWRSRLTSRKFLARRLIRIYPIYWVIALTYLLCHLLLLRTPYELSPSQLLAAALLLPPASSLVIGPGWTLSYEMYFYICFAVTLLAGLRGALLILSGFYFLSGLIGLLLTPHSPIGQVATNSLLLEFAGGAWLGYAFAHGVSVRPRAGCALIIAALAMFVSGFWLPYEHLPSVISWGIPSLLLVAGTLALEPWFRSRVGRAVARLGDSSYFLYLAHVLLIELLLELPIGWSNASVRAAVWLSFPLTAICTITAAVGYELIELPLLKAMKKAILMRSISRDDSSLTAS